MKLTTKARNKLPASALKMSKAKAAPIFAKANKVLHKGNRHQ